MRRGREPRTVPAAAAAAAAAATEGAAAAAALLEDVGWGRRAPRRKKATRRGGAQDAQPRRKSYTCSRGHRMAERARGGARRAYRADRAPRRR